MATKDLNLVMSNDALELLTCYQDGLDEVIAQVAEDCAAERAASQPGLAVEVTVEDVRRAGQALLEAVREMVRLGKVSATAIDAFQGMNDCAGCQ